MIGRLTELMVQSGATWVLLVLVALSVIALGVALERLWVFRNADAAVSDLVVQLRSLLARRDYAGAHTLLGEGVSVASRAASAGLAERDGGAAAAEEAMAASIGLARARLGRGLLILGTVGNNAPFIGLLGTVIGVVGAFDALGAPVDGEAASTAAAALAPERVMSTIAEALVATAVGLLVAIPAVAVFNYFQGRLNAAVQDAETLGHVLLSHLQGTRGSAGQDAARPEPDTLSASEATQQALQMAE